MRTFWTYILANRTGTVLYVGMTNNLARRCTEHRAATRKTFAGRYNVHYLMYYERFPRPMQAIRREKQLKAGSRAAKERLINSVNPNRIDLFDEVHGVVLPFP